MSPPLPQIPACVSKGGSGTEELWVLFLCEKTSSGELPQPCNCKEHRAAHSRCSVICGLNLSHYLGRRHTCSQVYVPEGGAVLQWPQSWCGCPLSQNILFNGCVLWGQQGQMSGFCLCSGLIYSKPAVTMDLGALGPGCRGQARSWRLGYTG